MKNPFIPQVKRSCPPYIQKQINELYEQGYEVILEYNRISLRPWTMFCITKHEFLVAYGVAECSLADRFCKATGTQIAFDRAMEAFRSNCKSSK